MHCYKKIKNHDIALRDRKCKFLLLTMYNIIWSDMSFYIKRSIEYLSIIDFLKLKTLILTFIEKNPDNKYLQVNT